MHQGKHYENSKVLVSTLSHQKYRLANFIVKTIRQTSCENNDKYSRYHSFTKVSKKHNVYYNCKKEKFSLKLFQAELKILSTYRSICFSVAASWKEPFPGWIDNTAGITGIMMEIGRGSIKSIMCEENLIMDLIPVDIVVNTLVTTAWHTAACR